MKVVSRLNSLLVDIDRLKTQCFMIEDKLPHHNLLSNKEWTAGEKARQLLYLLRIQISNTFEQIEFMLNKEKL